MCSWGLCGVGGSHMHSYTNGNLSFSFFILLWCPPYWILQDPPNIPLCQPVLWFPLVMTLSTTADDRKPVRYHSLIWFVAQLWGDTDSSLCPLYWRDTNADSAQCLWEIVVKLFVLVCWGCCEKYHNLGSLNNKNLKAGYLKSRYFARLFWSEGCEGESIPCLSPSF